MQLNKRAFQCSELSHLCGFIFPFNFKSFNCSLSMYFCTTAHQLALCSSHPDLALISCCDMLLCVLIRECPSAAKFTYLELLALYPCRYELSTSKLSQIKPKYISFTFHSCSTGILSEEKKERRGVESMFSGRDLSSYFSWSYSLPVISWGLPEGSSHEETSEFCFWCF